MATWLAPREPTAASGSVVTAHITTSSARLSASTSTAARAVTCSPMSSRHGFIDSGSLALWMMRTLAPRQRITATSARHAVGPHFAHPTT